MVSHSRESETVILSCEHGGNRVPDEYRPLFAGAEAQLESHRGWDPGAAALTDVFHRALDCWRIASFTTRLLVDLNRSLGSRSLFSEFTAPLPGDERQRILERFYLPYRHAVYERARDAVQANCGIVHLSLHSFVPVLNGCRRNADIGILFDPRRQEEGILARLWKSRMLDLLPETRVRFNYPYRGVSDCLVSALRKKLPESQYLGLELEVNHATFLTDRSSWRLLANSLVTSLIAALLDFQEQ